MLIGRPDAKAERGGISTLVESKGILGSGSYVFGSSSVDYASVAEARRKSRRAKVVRRTRGRHI
jgi:hypothetical protein